MSPVLFYKAELRRCLFTWRLSNGLGGFSAWGEAPEASILAWERSKQMDIMPQSPTPAQAPAFPCWKHIFPAPEISFFFSLAQWKPAGARVNRQREGTYWLLHGHSQPLSSQLAHVIFMVWLFREVLNIPIS